MNVLKFVWLITKPLVESFVFLPLCLIALVIVWPIIWVWDTWEMAKGNKSVLDRGI